jgi:D-alanyl-D-alanine carboxypeptidase/D-alanyl-D-alanine-endopeptidase (penicillin-binding protein 4)
VKNHCARRIIPPLFAILTTLLSAGCLGQPHTTVPSSSLTHRLDAVFDRFASTGAIIHARVIELPSRRELYARRSDEPCTPASNLKLLTSATGLDLFGPAHTFKTYLAQDGDDLWLIGTGDPGTGDPRLAKAAGQTPLTMLEAWAVALEHRGIHRIPGDLVYYDGAFDEQRVHPAWSKSFLTHWYAAPASGLNFNDNSIDFTVSPGEPDQPAKYEMMPPVDSVKIVNHCLTKPTQPSRG